MTTNLLIEQTVANLVLFLCGLMPALVVADTDKPSPIKQTETPEEISLSPEHPEGIRQYKFKLIKGKDLGVCEAYLQRLNRTQFPTIPYCGRPENDEILGFTKLHRKYLSVDDAYTIFPYVWTFSDSNSEQQGDGDSNWSKSAFYPGKSEHTDVPYGSVYAWRYDPPIDIDNDGIPDDVIVWQGLGVGGGTSSWCGDDVLSTYPGPLRVPQLAFVMSRDARAPIDVEKTRSIFWKTYNGNYAGIKLDQKYEAKGYSVSVFKYGDQTYFDTFYDVRMLDTLNKSVKKCADTLAVFLSEKGRTSLQCEIELNPTPIPLHQQTMGSN